MPANNYEYDYPFSTPTKNAVNKRIIERPISFPRLRRKNNTQPNWDKSKASAVHSLRTLFLLKNRAHDLP